MSRAVAIALSGGVDSSAAAALLVEQGEQPFGVTMRLFPTPTADASRLPGSAAREGRCCGGGDDTEVARAAAGVLGIPFFVLDFEDDFRRLVVDEFVQSYRAGRTPIPCAACNHDIKFDRLLARARGLGADRLATGHYARRERDPGTGRWRLGRAVDRDKDQTYFLFGLTQQMLEQVEFPVGDLKKDAVRALARRWSLPNADKPESQDLCFVPDGDYRRFVDDAAAEAEAAGDIVDRTGRVLGRHDGLSAFTVGQRRGLGIAAPRPLYVVAIETESRRVVVGEKTEVYCNELTATQVNWVSRGRPEQPTELLVQVRHRHEPVVARIEPLADDTARVVFSQPVGSPAPGQAAVFYDDDLLVGGGWIGSTVQVAHRVA